LYSQLLSGCVDFDGDSRVRQAQKLGHDHAGLRVAVVIRLQTSHHQIRLFVANSIGQDDGRSIRREVTKIVADNMKGAVSAASKRILDDAFHSLRSHRTDYNLTADFFADAKCFLEGVAV